MRSQARPFLFERQEAAAKVVNLQLQQALGDQVSGQARRTDQPGLDVAATAAEDCQHTQCLAPGHDRFHPDQRKHFPFFLEDGFRLAPCPGRHRGTGHSADGAQEPRPVGNTVEAGRTFDRQATVRAPGEQHQAAGGFRQVGRTTGQRIQVFEAGETPEIVGLNTGHHPGVVVMRRRSGHIGIFGKNRLNLELDII